MQLQNSILYQQVEGGISSIEFAWSIENIDNLINTWINNDVAVDIVLDLFYIPIYTYFFFTSLQVIKSILPKSSTLMHIGRYVNSICFLPLTFDYLENAILLFLFSGFYNEISIKITYLLAILKYVSMATIMGYLLLSFLIISIVKIKKTLN